MKRPAYTYLLMFIGAVALIAALTRPMIGALSVAPGATVDSGGVLTVQPGSPLELAGGVTGDLFVEGEWVTVEPGRNGGQASIVWSRGIPRSGRLTIRRAGERHTLELRPVGPVWPAGLAWSILGLLNTALVVLALALFWQHPRDGRAVLLGMVLLGAPVFAFPREPRLLSLVLATHFFSLFPPADRSRLRRWGFAAALYLPMLLLGLVGTALWESGRPHLASAIYDVLATGYAALSIVILLGRLPGAEPADRAVLKTLLVAAGAILAAVLLAVPRQLWVVADQFVPTNLVPAVVFGLALGHLVFRLRTLAVRVVARRTIQYLLARWTLGTLFLIPGFLLVWRFGQLSVTHEAAKSPEVLGYLAWMFVTALLLGRRRRVLENLDRRFFRDAESRRARLIQLAEELGRPAEAAAIVHRLRSGVQAALRPTRLEFMAGAPDAVDEGCLLIPLEHAGLSLGALLLGPRDDGEPYTEEELRLLRAAVSQAAVSLENAQLREALLARQREELTDRAQDVLTGQEEERRRLAADLHDQVLPELRHIAAEVERLRSRANGLTPELVTLESDVRGAMDSVREVMEALRPSTLDMLGLVDALEAYLRNHARRTEPRPLVSIQRSGPEPQLSDEQSLALYRIGQEAINNLLRHSGAGRAGLIVSVDERGLYLEIWDDGCGLPAETVGGRGLGNIAHRADLIGAVACWRARPGGGTSLSIQLRLQTGERAAGALVDGDGSSQPTREME